MNRESTTGELIDHSNNDDIQQTRKKKKKCRGNRVMQRYRRNLRKQNSNQGATTDMTDVSLVNKGSVTPEDRLQEEQKQTVEIVEHDIVDSPLKSIKQKRNKKNKKKQTIIKKVKVIGSEYSSKRKVKELPLIKDTFGYAKLSDAVFYQLYSTVFHDNEDLLRFLNTDAKIQLIRQYTSLVDRLSYVQLQEVQWKYYYDIGMTQNIWKHRRSKHQAAKYSIDYTYGRSKTIVQQRLKQIKQHLQNSQNAIQEFETNICSKSTQSEHCVCAMKKLFSVVHQFVQEKQQLLHYEHEYKREMLVLDATDHQLFQKFFDLDPNKSHVRRSFTLSFRHVYVHPSILVNIG